MEGFLKNARVLISQRVYSNISSLAEGTFVVGFHQNKLVKSLLIGLDKSLNVDNPIYRVFTNKGFFYCTGNVNVFNVSKQKARLESGAYLFSPDSEITVNKVEVTDEPVQTIFNLNTSHGFFVALSGYSTSIYVGPNNSDADQ